MRILGSELLDPMRVAVPEHSLYAESEDHVYAGIGSPPLRPWSTPCRPVAPCALAPNSYGVAAERSLPSSGEGLNQGKPQRMFRSNLAFTLAFMTEEYQRTNLNYE